MPDMDGAALAEEIGRRWPELAGRILLITGDALGADPAGGSGRAGCRSSRSRSTSRRWRPSCTAASPGTASAQMTGARASWWSTTSPTSGRCSRDYLGMQGFAVGTAADAAELDARLAEGAGRRDRPRRQHAGRERPRGARPAARRRAAGPG